MFTATIKANSISVRYRERSLGAHGEWAKRLMENTPQSAINLRTPRSSWSLSYQSRTKLLDSVNFLHSTSRARTISVSSKKKIYGFKSSFVTLTLPSTQIHSDIIIKSCLNSFLVKMRSIYGLKNYVWKAELQANDNIHFHLVFDIFIHHKAIRFYWNQSIEVLGYVTRYRTKFEGMTLVDYASARGVDIHKALSGFQFGNATGWKSPSTEQAITIHTSGELGGYLSKYMVKGSGKTIDVHGSDNPKEYISIRNLVRIRRFGRVWGRSQSLSKIVYVSHWDWSNLLVYLRSISKDLSGLHKKIYDYCTVYYYDYKLKDNAIRRFLDLQMRELAVTYQYIYP